MTVFPEYCCSDTENPRLGLGSVASEWHGHSHIFTLDSPLPAVRIEGADTSAEFQRMVLSQKGTILGIEIDEQTLAVINDKAGTYGKSLPRNY